MNVRERERERESVGLCICVSMRLGTVVKVPLVVYDSIKSMQSDEILKLETICAINGLWAIGTKLTKVSLTSLGIHLSIRV